MTRVSSLSNTRSCAWEVKLIRRFFDNATSSGILALKSSFVPMDDSMYWKFTLNGTFSVRPAYAMP